MKDSNIEETNITYSFWQGCSKISPGCQYCNMFRTKASILENGSSIRRIGDGKSCKLYSIKNPCMVLLNSQSDFFLKEADDWRKYAWKVIRETPHLTYQILTKRPERIMKCLPDDWGTEGYPNVWLGVSIEEQFFLHRAETLSKVPAKVRFISAEPLLEEINFLITRKGKRIIDDFQWVILGGEIGNECGEYKYRYSDIAWYERAINDLKSQTNVAVFMKQLGSHLRKTLKLKHYHGGELAEWPGSLQIREFPGLNIKMVKQGI